MVALASLAALAVLGLQPPEPGSYAWLRWQAPAGVCPDAVSVAARIEALSGTTVDPATLQVDAVVQASADGFELQLRVAAADAVDVRSLHAERCATLADAAALVAGVWVDPVATAAAVDVPQVVATTTPAIAVAGPASPRSSARADATVDRPRAPARLPRRAALGVWLRGRGGVAVGVTPGASASVELALGVGVRRVRGELAGSWVSPRSARVADTTVRVQLGTIAPRVCTTWPLGPLDLAGCGGLAIGAVQAEIAGGATRRPLWLAAQLEAGVRVPVSPRVSIWIGGQAQLPLRFPVFRLVDPVDPARTRVVHRAAAAGVHALAGVELRLRGLDKRQ
ncbi:MAG: hypothetical protein U0168_07010 [Nannocystaceae bacterium]